MGALVSVPIERRAGFSEIRYANCWEDGSVVAEALEPLDGSRCLSIASGGDNCFSLLARGASEVVAVDLSPAQMALVELKAAAFRRLSHPELLGFIGAQVAPEASRPFDAERSRAYSALRPDLSAAARGFWDARPLAIGRGILHAGRLEAYFRVFRRRVLPLVHRRKDVAAVFEPRDEGARARFYDRTWDTWRWRLLFRLFCGRLVLGRLGRDAEFFRYVDGAVAGPLLARTRHGFTAVAPHANPFMRFLLEGAFGPVLPDYLRLEHHERIRAGLGSLRLCTGPVRDAGRWVPTGGVDAFNLSDVAEYMSPDEHARLLGSLRPLAAPGARFAYWNLFAERRLHDLHGSGLEPRAELAERLHARAGTFFYARLVLEVAR